MPPNCTPLLLPTALLLGLLPIVTANAHSGNHALNPDTTMEMPQPAAMTPQFDDHELENYFRLGQYSAWMNGHIFVMILTWAVLLPLGKTFLYLARSILQKCFGTYSVLTDPSDLLQHREVTFCATCASYILRG